MGYSEMSSTCKPQPSVQWECSTNNDGRVVYKLRVPARYSLSANLGGVVDYDPKSPRYKAIRIYPYVLAEWFYTLPEAKQFLVTELVTWELSK